MTPPFVRVARLLPGLLVLLVLLAGAAQATSPGTQAARFREAVTHTCENDPAIQCEEFLAPGAPFSGSECGVPNPVCVPEFIEGAVIRATVTLIGQEQGNTVCVDDPSIVCETVTPLGEPGYTGEECPQPAPDPPCFWDDQAATNFITATILIEFQIDGETFVIAETYTAPPGQLRIGPWTNPIFNEAINTFEFVNQIPINNQRDIQIKLREIAKAKFGEDGIPLIVDRDRKTPELEVEEISTSLGSVRRFRVEFRFARGTPPSSG